METIGWSSCTYQLMIADLQGSEFSELGTPKNIGQARADSLVRLQGMALQTPGAANTRCKFETCGNRTFAMPMSWQDLLLICSFVPPLLLRVCLQDKNFQNGRDPHPDRQCQCSLCSVFAD